MKYNLFTTHTYTRADTIDNNNNLSPYKCQCCECVSKSTRRDKLKATAFACLFVCVRVCVRAIKCKN